MLEKDAEPFALGLIAVKTRFIYLNFLNPNLPLNLLAKLNREKNSIKISTILFSKSKTKKNADTAQFFFITASEHIFQSSHFGGLAYRRKKLHPSQIA